MGSWKTFLFAYILGGLTFIPLLIAAVLIHAYFSFRYKDGSSTNSNGQDDIVQPGDDTADLDSARAAAKGEVRTRASHGPDVAAGYFAVCREYTPMGINAKPIERPTPVGSTTVTAPSPSVYQTMYRSIFERKPAAGPLDSKNKQMMGQRPKKAGNVFYVALRHGHLMLFDDEDQLEVRHVISLANHDVSIYSGGDTTPEGELFIKRNAICLSRKTSEDAAPDGLLPKPFYLFSEDCSAKEDFYFALLKSHEQTMTADGKPPTPKQFDVKHIIALVQKLHSSEEYAQTKWLNALLGRIFLSVYRTADLEHFIRKLIMKKISRVKRPSFLTNIAVQGMDIGEAAPFFSNFKLKDLTIEGETVVEADVKYAGNFRIEVATTAKIDLGGRFKVREVNLVLALVLKRIEGHIFFKVKPPPSNRLWFSFQTMPKMEMLIEPVVSSRQITYTVILRHIENRIKEVFAETLVQPFWDDVPFFKTEHKTWRGGIFEDDAVEGDDDVQEAAVQSGDVEAMDRVEEHHELLAETPPATDKSQNIPILDAQPASTGLFGRRMGTKSSVGSANSASSTSLDAKGSTTTTSAATPSPRLSKMVHSPEPVVGTNSSHADVFKPSTSPPDYATNYMSALHSRSMEPSPATTPMASPMKPETLAEASLYSSSSSREALDMDRQPRDNDDGVTPTASKRRSTASSAESANLDLGAHPPSSPQSTSSSLKSQTGSLGRNFFLRRDGTNGSSSSPTSINTENGTKKNTLAAVTNAANQARQWGWNAIQRQRDARKGPDSPGPIDLTQPMGRGQPLPPPGTPLPRPTNGMTKIGPMPVPKRKPVTGPPLPDRPGEESGLNKENNPPYLDAAPPLPNRRRRGVSQDQDDGPQSMLVVAAPTDSQPNSPAVEERLSPFQPTFQDAAAASSQPPTSALHEVALGSDIGTSLGADVATDAATEPGTAHTEPLEAPIMAVPAPVEAEDDDDYSGWMENDDMEDDNPPLDQPPSKVAQEAAS